MLAEKAEALTRKVERAIFYLYLRKGHVPEELNKLLSLSREIEIYLHQTKYNPNWQSQPRIPTGQPEAGQWTDGDNGEVEPGLVPEPAPWELLFPLGLMRNVLGFIAKRTPPHFYFLIGKQRFSGHSLARMEERKIPLSVVSHVIKTGKKHPARDGAIAYYDAENNVTIVMDKRTRNIITLRKGKP